jgi:hypothetical protein
MTAALLHATALLSIGVLCVLAIANLVTPRWLAALILAIAFALILFLTNPTPNPL